MNKITFVTRNENKVIEAEAILGVSLKHKKLDLDEIQDLEVENVVRKKAVHAFEQLQKPLFVEDVGVYVHVWKGFPGALVKYIETGVGYLTFLKWLALENDHSTTVKAALAYHDGREVQIFTGQVDGKIVLEPRGEHGFGFDSIFEPEGSDKTYGEMTSEEKNSISHRRKVYEKFREILENQDKT